MNRWSDENAIKFAQRPFLYVILFGLALAYASVPLLLDTAPTRGSCATQLFLVHGAFALVFTTIVAKMWRVMKISQVATSLQKRAITNQVCGYAKRRRSNGQAGNGGRPLIPPLLRRLHLTAPKPTDQLTN